MPNDDFASALKQAYTENPCQVLPNPLWQTLARLPEFETAHAASGDNVNRLEAWNDSELHIYWRQHGRQPSLLISRRLAYQQAAIIHQDFLDAPTVAGFSSFHSYYRLIHHGQLDTAPVLPEGLRFVGVVNSPEEVQAMVAHIAQDDSNLLDTVQAWLKRPVFAPDLWLWVIDSATDQPVGLGVGELDSDTREAALTWVQVLPDYQRRGIGRAIVHELLHRVAGRVAFTTVSGPVEDRENPGAFFRRCGFTGEDVWWYLRRD